MSVREDVQAALLNSEVDPHQAVKEALSAIAEFAFSAELEMDPEDLMAELETAMSEES